MSLWGAPPVLTTRNTPHIGSDRPRAHMLAITVAQLWPDPSFRRSSERALAPSGNEKHSREEINAKNAPPAGTQFAKA